MVAQKKVPVYERGLHIFRDEVVRNPRVKDRLLEMLLDLVAREVRRCPHSAPTRLLMVPQLMRARRSPGSVAARWLRAA